MSRQSGIAGFPQMFSGKDCRADPLAQPGRQRCHWPNNAVNRSGDVRQNRNGQSIVAARLRQALAGMLTSRS